MGSSVVTLLKSVPENIHTWLKENGFKLANQGQNSQIYKRKGNGLDIKIKISTIDFHERVERELNALCFLETTGVQKQSTVPFSKRLSSTKQILVTEWMPGNCLTQQLTEDVDIYNIVEYLSILHSKPIDNVLKDASFNMRNREECLSSFDYQLSFIKKASESSLVRVETFKLLPTPKLFTDVRCFCHVDNNLGNFLVNKDKMYAVDWEYSGVSSPVFDLAQLVCHPNYLKLPRVPDLQAILEFYNRHKLTTDINRQEFDYICIALVLWWILHIERQLQCTEFTYLTVTPNQLINQRYFFLDRYDAMADKYLNTK